MVWRTGAGLVQVESLALSPDGLSTTLQDGFWAQLNLVYWHLLAQDASYWDAFGQARVFEHLWSIAVEAQFHLVWPIVNDVAAWSLRSRAVQLNGVVLGIALVLAIASLIVMVALLELSDPMRVYTGPDRRTFSLLLGTATATSPVLALFDRMVATARESCGWAAAVLVAGIALFWVLADGTGTPGLFTGGLFVHGAACATLISSCAAISRQCCLDSVTAPALRPPVIVRALQCVPLTYLGGISYSHYLWHWPVIVLWPHEESSLPRKV